MADLFSVSSAKVRHGLPTSMHLLISHLAWLSPLLFQPFTRTLTHFSHFAAPLTTNQDGAFRSVNSLVRRFKLTSLDPTVSSCFLVSFHPPFLTPLTSLSPRRFIPRLAYLSVRPRHGQGFERDDRARRGSGQLPVQAQGARRKEEGRALTLLARLRERAKLISRSWVRRARLTSVLAASTVRPSLPTCPYSQSADAVPSFPLLNEQASAETRISHRRRASAAARRPRRTLATKRASHYVQNP